MNNLILNNSIIEKRDITNISYILEDKSLFFETGYKVLQNQEKNGFIKAVKVIHNGKVKLIYDISEYKSLLSIIHTLRAQDFLVIMSKLFDILCETIDNGFMQIENININFENIFIDTNNLNVNLIYIPVNGESDSNSKGAFEEELKVNIIRAISSNRNINNEVVNKLYSNLSLGNSTIEVLRDYIKTLSYSSSYSEKAEVKVTREEIAKMSQPRPEKKYEAKAPEKKNNGFFSKITGIFKNSSKKEKDIQGNVKSEKEKVTIVQEMQTMARGNASYGDLETELLSGDMLLPTIALVSINSAEGINIIIDKEVFIIGKSAQMADGVISFNKAISRVHCRITNIDGKYFIKDEESANGTFVNNKKLARGEQAPIKIGDKIRLANSDFEIKSI